MKGVYFCIFLLLCVVGCKKDRNQHTSNSEQITIDNDQALLGSRLNTSEAGVVYVDPSAGGQQKTTADSSSNQYPMELVASVSAPVHGGDTLRATHVEINGNYAYVSYNTEGAKYKGGIDVFNISVPTTPVLVSSVIFPTTDISAIAYYENKIYMAGAREGSNPAIVGYLQLTGGLPSSTFASVRYGGFTGTGIAIWGSTVYLTTGTNGGLYVLSPNLNQLRYISQADARCVAANSLYVAVQTGSSGIKIYDRNYFVLQRTISMPIDIAESKRTMDFNGNSLFVAAGKGGNAYFDATTAGMLSQISLPLSITGVLNSNDIVTNAVSYNNGLLFSANGAAGAYISKLNTGTQVLTRLGSFGFGNNISVNYVKCKDNYVFVAAGKGGMKIIRFTQTSGTASCTGLSNYTGSTNLNVISNQNLSYGGSLLLTSLNVNAAASLFYCGALAISDNVNINSNGTLEIQGTFSFGSAGKTLIINSNGKLKISGNVTIYGNLILNSNAKMEFSGPNNSITIHGTVTKGANVSISGTYTDISGKL